jgi:hypothetical protein
LRFGFVAVSVIGGTGEGPWHSFVHTNPAARSGLESDSKTFNTPPRHLRAQPGCMPEATICSVGLEAVTRPAERLAIRWIETAFRC